MDSPDDIFLNAREIGDPTDRAAYLAQACGADTVVRERVEALLRDADGAKDFFGADDILPGMVAAPLTEGPGTIIGRYKLLQKIGEGGMGVVYMAEQREPVVRKVALKIIKLGMDTRQVLGRFEAERQALALMDHPNIAKILDGGATDTGRPYFVMDLVQGLPITRFCDEANLSTRDRLDLFLEVCSAIQHAHQKGIIHRDIKPANILVTLHGDKPVPKVIDFGIAKATQGRLTEKTLFTQFQHFIGTPAYMSPEQASLSGLDVDTRSDIYALGVLLYELLTGKTPFDEKELMKSGLDEMRRTIREREPLRPSTRLSSLAGEELITTARHRRLDASRLISTLRGDLDWIVMKCLEKDRARRYETANGLATDLKRQLANEPVIARPPNQLYRLQKLVRRNRVAFAAGAALTAVLLLAVVVSTWQAVRATRAEQEQSRLRESEAKQRQQAVVNEQKAQAAQAKETQLRQQAQAQAYASDMKLVQRALEMNNIGSALNLLNRHRPIQTQHSPLTSQPSTDLRGWEWRYLWNQCQSDAESVFCKSSNAIKSLAVSHDGAWLATGLSETGVSIWDLAKRQEIAHLPASGFYVRVAFSPREPLLAYSDIPNNGSASTNHSIHLWNGATRQVVRTLSIGDQSYGTDEKVTVYGVAFSEDGRTLAASTRNPGNQITLWRVSDGKKLASYHAPQTGVGVGTPFALAGDLSVATHATKDDRVRVIDLGTGQERWQRKATDEFVLALALSPDGKILASGAGFADAVIRLWDVASGSELGRLEGHRSGIHQLIFWPDGKSLASASFDQTIRLWNVSDPAKGRPLNILRGHRSYVRGIALLPPDNTTLVSGSEDTVCLWNAVATRQKRKLLTLPIPVGLWRFTPDSKSVVTAEDHDGVGHVAQWSQDTDFQAMQPLFDVGTNIHEGCFSGDGRWLAVSRASGDLDVWDLQSRRPTCEFTAHARPALPRAFTAGGRKLMIVHPKDNSLHEWDLTTRQETRSWPTAVGRYTGAFSPDGKWYLTSILNPDTKTVTSLVELSNGRETNLSQSWYYAASFSADGRLFALGGWGENAVRLFETATAKEVGKLRGIQGQIFGLGFSPDATRFMICYGGHEGSQEIVTLHDMESYEKLLSLEGPGSMFEELAFSPDGNVLAAWNRRGVLHFWRAPSWAEIEAAEKAHAR